MIGLHFGVDAVTLHLNQMRVLDRAYRQTMVDRAEVVAIGTKRAARVNEPIEREGSDMSVDCADSEDLLVWSHGEGSRACIQLLGFGYKSQRRKRS